MKNHHPRIAGALFMSAFAASLIPTVKADPPSGLGYPATPVFEEQFTGSSLDSTRWFALKGASGSAIRTPVAVSVSGDALNIRTYTEIIHGEPYHFTGAVSSQNKVMPLWGYMEARIAFRDNSGQWSSFYMMSPQVSDVGIPGGPLLLDPVNKGVEMDIVEHRAKNSSNNDISSQVQSAVHWNGYASYSHQVSEHFPTATGLTPDNYNLYAMDWTPDSTSFYVNGNLAWTIPNTDPEESSVPVSQRAQFFYLMSEVGGTWAGPVPGGLGYNTLNDSANSLMRVDHVKIWQRQLKLTNRLNGYAMTLETPGTNDTPVEQNPFNSTYQSHRWQIDFVETEAGTNAALYKIVNHYSGRCITRVTNGSNIDIRQVTDTDATNQKWRLYKDSNGYFSIKTPDSSQCLAAPIGGSTGWNLKLVTFDTANPNQQQWTIDYAP